MEGRRRRIDAQFKGEKKTADEKRKDDGEEWSVGRRIMTELINIHFWT